MAGARKSGYRHISGTLCGLRQHGGAGAVVLRVDIGKGKCEEIISDAPIDVSIGDDISVMGCVDPSSGTLRLPADAVIARAERPHASLPPFEVEPSFSTMIARFKARQGLARKLHGLRIVRGFFEQKSSVLITSAVTRSRDHVIDWGLQVIRDAGLNRAVHIVDGDAYHPRMRHSLGARRFLKNALPKAFDAELGSARLNDFLNRKAELWSAGRSRSILFAPSRFDTWAGIWYGRTGQDPADSQPLSRPDVRLRQKFLLAERIGKLIFDARPPVTKGKAENRNVLEVNFRAGAVEAGGKAGQEDVAARRNAYASVFALLLLARDGEALDDLQVFVDTDMIGVLNLPAGQIKGPAMEAAKARAAQLAANGDLTRLSIKEIIGQAARLSLNPLPKQVVPMLEKAEAILEKTALTGLSNAGWMRRGQAKAQYELDLLQTATAYGNSDEVKRRIAQQSLARYGEKGIDGGTKLLGGFEVPEIADSWSGERFASIMQFRNDTMQGYAVGRQYEMYFRKHPACMTVAKP